MTNFISGDLLTDKARCEALRRFVHRFTGDHTPSWARVPRADGTAYMVQFKNDLDWLSHSEFAVNKDGSLSANHKYCVSHPTWPFGQSATQPVCGDAS